VSVRIAKTEKSSPHSAYVSVEIIQKRDTELKREERDCLLHRTRATKTLRYSDLNVKKIFEHERDL
jgi:hypothetical protein